MKAILDDIEPYTCVEVVVSGRKPVCPLSFVVPEFQCEAAFEFISPFKIMVLTQLFFVEKFITRL